GRRVGAETGKLGDVPSEVVIWTTTPWTLPANQAVALHGELRYVLVEASGESGKRRLILAADLLQSSLTRFGLQAETVLAEFTGNALEGLKLRHPFQDREVPVI